MKNLENSVLGLVVLLLIQMNFSMEAKEISLPRPATEGGMGFNEVVARRHSVREYDNSRTVDNGLLGQLLWAAVGVNRWNATAPAPGKNPADRTNPTALNSQEITAYVFDEKGVWVYKPQSHSIEMLKEGDYRGLVAGTEAFSQDFVLDAPYSIVFVADLSKLPEGAQSRMMAAMDAGIACENLNLACCAAGLATVPRATMDADGIAALLGLTPAQVPMLNNPIGYAR